MSESIDVLVPTRNRPAALAVTLAALGAQSWPRLRIVLADQSDQAGQLDLSAEPAESAQFTQFAQFAQADGRQADAQAALQAVLRYLRATGRELALFQRPARRGMAEQRAFLLDQARASCCLFLDDDVITEPDLLARLHAVLREEACGFVGSAVHGLSHLGQARPAQEAIEFWEGPVRPETVRPGTPAWARHHLHSAANLFHLQARLGRRPGRDRRYKVAWVGACVLFDTAMLRSVGGFDFWQQLPPEHCGEDVLAQQRVMARYGGCAIFPSGAYHMELPTTVTAREVDAPHVLPAGASMATGLEAGLEAGLETGLEAGLPPGASGAPGSPSDASMRAALPPGAR